MINIILKNDIFIKFNILKLIELLQLVLIFIWIMSWKKKPLTIKWEASFLSGYISLLGLFWVFTVAVAMVDGSKLSERGLHSLLCKPVRAEKREGNKRQGRIMLHYRTTSKSKYCDNKDVGTGFVASGLPWFLRKHIWGKLSKRA